MAPEHKVADIAAGTVAAGTVVADTVVARTVASVVAYIVGRNLVVVAALVALVGAAEHNPASEDLAASEFVAASAVRNPLVAPVVDTDPAPAAANLAPVAVLAIADPDLPSRHFPEVPYLNSPFFIVLSS